MTQDDIDKAAERLAMGMMDMCDGPGEDFELWRARTVGRVLLDAFDAHYQPTDMGTDE